MKLIKFFYIFFNIMQHTFYKLINNLLLYYYITTIIFYYEIIYL